MDNKQRIKNIVLGLIRQTKNGEIKWEESVIPEQFNFLKSSITISVFRYNEDKDSMIFNEADYYGILFLNNEGKIIERAMNNQLFNIKDICNLKELYDLARRSAYNTDEILKKLEDELSEDELSDVPF